MLRTRPHDDDTLYQVDFDTKAQVDDQPPGARHCATFARNSIEAMHLTRNQFGADHVQSVEITGVCTREREKNGTVHTTHLFPTRRRETVMPDDLPEAAYG